MKNTKLSKEDREKIKRDTINYFSECNRLGDRVLSDGAKIIALETIINNLVNERELTEGK